MEKYGKAWANSFNVCQFMGFAPDSVQEEDMCLSGLWV